jgi:HPt (histidine-containing phosphotransfer) domain-containing protein
MDPTHSEGTRSKPGSMRTIFALVGVAIIVFMAFSAYSVRKEIQGSAQLSTIKDRYFPLLQRLDANIVRLDKIEELYVQVVLTGDRDTIAKATQVGVEADQAFAEISALYPAQAPLVAQLRSDLKTYQDLATKTSLAYLSQDRATAAPMAAKMNQALAEVGQRLRALRETAYRDFVETLARSQADARLRLYMGLALGVMNLGFMAVLVYFIRNNLRMMAVIEVQNATLEQRVAERTLQLSQKTADINAMLHNMNLGVSTVIPGNLIHSEYSNYLRTIFSIDDVAGKDLILSLFARSTLGEDTKDQIAVALGAILGEDEMMFALNGHLLVREMNLIEDDGVHKTVQMEWSPIVSEQGRVDKVLLIAQDVTHLRELEQSSAHQQEELEIITRIIRVAIGRFNDFVRSAGEFLAANRRLLEDPQARDRESVAVLFRNMHTIKGNARTFDFTHVTEAAHRAEQTYDRLRKDPELPWDTATMLAELGAVEAAVARYVLVNEDTLGRKGRASDLLTARGAFVGNDQLSELRSLAAALADDCSEAALLRLRIAISRLGLIPLPRLISGAVDSLSSLAKELHKPTPAVEIDNCEVAFTSQFAEAFKSCCMHILRNALDHGIEDPAARIAAGKAGHGTVRVACRPHGEGLELELSDDGRGLALQRLYDKARACNLVAADARPTRAEVAALIFHAGLSTATEVTQVSGRGVGMDAVRTFLREQGASIRVQLADPAGTELDYAAFHFVIDVPPSACAY